MLCASFVMSNHATHDVLAKGSRRTKTQKRATIRRKAVKPARRTTKRLSRVAKSRVGRRTASSRRLGVGSKRRSTVANRRTTRVRSTRRSRAITNRLVKSARKQISKSHAYAIKNRDRYSKPGITVLGKYTHLSDIRIAFRKAANPLWSDYKGYYARVGEKSRAKTHWVPDSVYKGMPKAQRKAAQRANNTKFLNRAIARGDRIRLSSRGKHVNRTYAWEIKYVLSKGYRRSKDGKWLDPP